MSEPKSRRLDPALLELLACPLCKGALVLAKDEAKLTCAACRRDYPVNDGIPDLVP